MHHVDTSQMPQRRSQDVLSRAIARRRIGELARVGFGIGHQLFERVKRQILARHQGVAVTHGKADGFKITQAVVGQFFIQAHVEGDVGHRAHQQAVAIRVCFGCSIGTDQGA